MDQGGGNFREIQVLAHRGAQMALLVTHDGVTHKGVTYEVEGRPGGSIGGRRRDRPIGGLLWHRST